MQEQLITFETAKLAKEKGLCDYFEDINPTDYVPAFYSEDGVNFEETEFQQEDCVIQDRYYRPTQSLLQKWLREVHNIGVYVLPYSENLGKKHYEVIVNNTMTYSLGCVSYEEALEVGLQEALKLIK